MDALAIAPGSNPSFGPNFLAWPLAGPPWRGGVVAQVAREVAAVEQAKGDDLDFSDVAHLVRRPVRAKTNQS